MPLLLLPFFSRSYAANVHAPNSCTPTHPPYSPQDTGNNKVRRIVTSSRIVTTLAGGGASGTASGELDAMGTAALFTNIVAVAVDASGAVYTGTVSVRVIAPTGAVSTLFSPLNVSSIAAYSNGSALVVASTDASSAKLSMLACPATTCTVPPGYYCAAGWATTCPVGAYCVGALPNFTLCHPTSACPLAGLSAQYACVWLASSPVLINDNSVQIFPLNTPLGIASDARGNPIIADAGNFQIVVINASSVYDGVSNFNTSSSGVVSLLAGNGVQGALDGGKTSATFNNPSGVSLDASGNVYIAGEWVQDKRKGRGTLALTPFPCVQIGSTT